MADARAEQVEKLEQESWKIKKRVLNQTGFVFNLQGRRGGKKVLWPPYSQ